MIQPKRPLYEFLNVSKHVCAHLLGNKQKPRHRITVGVFIMFIGVCIAKTTTEYFAVHLLCDMTGYFLHGIGAIPLLEKLAELSNET